MKYDFDAIIDRRNTNAMKYCMGKELIEMGVTPRFDEETIPAFTADMDIRCAQPIINALKERAEHGIFGYTMINQDSEYYGAVVNWFSRRYQWKIEKDDITYTRGTVKALESGVRAFTKRRDGVIIMRPVYGPFATAIENAGRIVVDCHLLHDKRGYYTIDFEKFEKLAKDPKNSAFILCNPHNPVGRVWTQEELKRISTICKENKVMILSDDVHADLIRRESKYLPIALSDPANENIVTFTAVNKTFNLAGLAITHVIIPNQKLRVKFRKTHGSDFPSLFVIPALIAAYNESEDWLEQLIDYLDGNIDWVLQFMKERIPKAVCYRPEGTYVLWMDFSALGLSHEELRERIYAKANVVLGSGYYYDPNGSACIERMCIPMSRKRLQEAFYRIADALDADVS